MTLITSILFRITQLEICRGLMFFLLSINKIDESRPELLLLLFAVGLLEKWVKNKPVMWFFRQLSKVCFQI